MTLYGEPTNEGKNNKMCNRSNEPSIVYNNNQGPSQENEILTSNEKQEENKLVPFQNSGTSSSRNRQQVSDSTRNFAKRKPSMVSYYQRAKSAMNFTLQRTIGAQLWRHKADYMSTSIDPPYRKTYH